MSRGSAIAKRYARAVFGLAEETAGAEQLLLEIDSLTEEILASPDLRRVLLTPLYPRNERRAVLSEIADRLGSPRDVRAVAMILVDENRTQLLPAIRDALRELVDRAAGRVVAKVTSARPLDAQQSEELRQALGRRVNAEVTLDVEVDERLIGGVVARVGDLLFDGSVRTQLESLGANLRKGSE